MRFPFSPHLYQYLLFVFFLVITILTDAILICISWISDVDHVFISDVDHLFMLAVGVLFLEEISLQVFCPFFN